MSIYSGEVGFLKAIVAYVDLTSMMITFASRMILNLHPEKGQLSILMQEWFCYSEGIRTCSNSFWCLFLDSFGCFGRET